MSRWRAATYTPGPDTRGSIPNHECCDSWPYRWTKPCFPNGRNGSPAFSCAFSPVQRTSIRGYMSKPRPRSIKPTLRGATLGAALWFAAGCGAVDDLLDVDLPSQIAEDTFLAPQNAARIVNGAISDFECMLAMYVVAGGLVGDELVDGQLNNDMADYDRRSFNAATGLYAIGACPTV